MPRMQVVVCNVEEGDTEISHTRTYALTHMHMEREEGIWAAARSWERLPEPLEGAWPQRTLTLAQRYWTRSL